MIPLRYATDNQVRKIGTFVSNENGDEELTTLSIANTDILLSKSGSTVFAAKNSGGATHAADGDYCITFDAIDSNTLGEMVLKCHITGALYVRERFIVLPQNVYDWLYGAGNLDVNSVQLGGVAAALQIAETVPTVNDIRDSILSDATRFAGANINAAIDSRSSHSPEDVRVEIDANSEKLDVAVGTRAAPADIPEIPTDYAKEATSQAVKERTDRLPDMPASSGEIPSVEAIQGYVGSEPADVSDRTSYGMLRLLFGRFFNRNEATATEHVTYDESGETVKVRRQISETETTQTIGKAT